MSGSTSAKRAVHTLKNWKELLNLLNLEGVTLRNIEDELDVSRKVAARALGGPPRAATPAEREERALIKRIGKLVPDAKRRLYFELVLNAKIPPEVWRWYMEARNAELSDTPVFS
jgi:hypothetical protein